MKQFGKCCSGGLFSPIESPVESTCSREGLFVENESSADKALREWDSREQIGAAEGLKGRGQV